MRRLFQRDIYRDAGVPVRIVYDDRYIREEIRYRSIYSIDV